MDAENQSTAILSFKYNATMAEVEKWFKNRVILFYLLLR